MYWAGRCEIILGGRHRIHCHHRSSRRLGVLGFRNELLGHHLRSYLRLHSCCRLRSFHLLLRLDQRTDLPHHLRNLQQNLRQNLQRSHLQRECRISIRMLIKFLLYVTLEICPLCPKAEKETCRKFKLDFISRSV